MVASRDTTRLASYMGMENTMNLTGLPGYVAPIRLNGWRRRALLGTSIRLAGEAWIVRDAHESGILVLARDGMPDRAFPFNGLVATGSMVAYAGSWVAAAEWLAIH